MRIDTTTIEGYENMTPDERITALLAYEMPDVGGDETAKLRASLQRANSEAASFKKSLREKQSDDERKAAEQAEREKAMQDELDALRKQVSISKFKTEFAKLGYDDANASTAAEALTTGNFVQFFQSSKAFLESRDREAVKSALRNTPEPTPGADAARTVTQDEFDKMSYAERTQLFEDNRELYDELTKG